MPSVRHFINFAAKRGLPLHQLDIMTASLNAPMDYEVDVELDAETVNVMRELAVELKMGEISAKFWIPVVELNGFGPMEPRY